MATTKAARGPAIREKALASLSPVLVGQRENVDLCLIASFVGGHVLLEGAPGLAKTLLVKSLARAWGLSFGRVQFTPDLMPADILGYEMLEDAKAGRQMRFVPGPIFAQMILADEINRTPPRTQSALLEAMQEGSVHLGGRSHELPEPFFVFATQNPIEQEGTYPLPEAQLDRFLFRIEVDYPDVEEEVRIAGLGLSERKSVEVTAALGPEDLLKARREASEVFLAPEVLAWMVRLIRSTRPGDPTAPASVRRSVRLGASPRASRLIASAAKASAWLDGKAAVEKKHVEKILVPLLGHRLLLGYGAEADGVGAREILAECAKIPL